MKMSKSGFSLLEALVAVALLGIVTGAVAFTISGVVAHARSGISEANIALLNRATAQYIASGGSLSDVPANPSSTSDELEVCRRIIAPPSAQDLKNSSSAFAPLLNPTSFHPQFGISTQPRAVWVGNGFVAVSDQTTPGIIDFISGDELQPSPNAVRSFTVDMRQQGTWIWDYDVVPSATEATAAPLQLSPPQFLAPFLPGSYQISSFPLSVALLNPNPAGVSTIHYTTDGSNPTITSPTWSNASYTGNQMPLLLKAACFPNVANYSASAPTVGGYLLNLIQLSPPAFTTQPGTFPSSSLPLNIDFSNPNSQGTSVIRYTTNGTAPTSTSPIWSATTFSGTQLPVTITAAAFPTGPGYAPSSPISGTFSVIVQLAIQIGRENNSNTAVQFSEVTGQTNRITLTQTSNVSGVTTISPAYTIVYNLTVNGTTPTAPTSATNGTVYSGPINWPAAGTWTGPLQIAAAAFPVSGDSSVVTASTAVRGTYSPQQIALSAPQISPASTTSAVLPFNVSIAPAAADVAYTSYFQKRYTNGASPGTTPTSSSALYSTGFSIISLPSTVEAIEFPIAAYSTWFQASPAAVANYSLNPVPPLLIGGTSLVSLNSSNVISSIFVGSVNSIIKQSGKFIVGGGFQFDGYTNIVRLTSALAVDTTWGTVGGSIGASNVNTLLLSSVGTVYIGFGSTTGSMIRATANGFLDSTFTLNQGSLATASTQNGQLFNGGVTCAYELANGNVFIGINPPAENWIAHGTSVSPTYAYWPVPLVSKTGTIVTTFAASETTTSPANAVTSIALRTDGNYWFAGNFPTFPAGSALNNGRQLICVSPTGAVVSGVTQYISLNGSIKQLLMQASGQVIAVGSGLIGGIERFNANGSRDTTFNAGGTGVSSGGSINVIVPLTNGEFIVGGTFSTFNGVARTNIALLKSDGTLDTSWTPPTNVPAFIESIVTVP